LCEPRALISPQGQTSRSSRDLTSRGWRTTGRRSGADRGDRGPPGPDPGAHPRPVLCGRPLEVCLACDLIWAAEGSQIGQIEARGRRDPRTAAGPSANRVADRLSTRRGDGVHSRHPPAGDACLWGLINRVVPVRGLSEEGRAYAQSLASGPTRAHAATKRMPHAWRSGGVGHSGPTRITAPPKTGRVDGSPARDLHDGHPQPPRYAPGARPGHKPADQEYAARSDPGSKEERDAQSPVDQAHRRDADRKETQPMLTDRLVD